MRKLLVFGNSGSGKSTIAARLARESNLAHLDLDTLAWLPGNPPKRMPLADSLGEIEEFTEQHDAWVVEGCYTDLLEAVAAHANEVLFLNLPIAQCIENARARPFEPHKYETREAQDANLPMLLDWIAQYETREDVFSLAAHTKFYESFSGKKTCLRANEEVFS